MEMVFLKGKEYYVSRSRKSVARSQSEAGTGAPTAARKEGNRKPSTHICVLSIDASRRDDPCALLVLVEDDRIGIDVALDDLKSGLVCDSIAVSERWVTSSLCPRGHNMGVLRP